jgi:hypothetical protein
MKFASVTVLACLLLHAPCLAFTLFGFDLGNIESYFTTTATPTEVMHVQGRLSHVGWICCGQSHRLLPPNTSPIRPTKPQSNSTLFLLLLSLHSSENDVCQASDMICQAGADVPKNANEHGKPRYIPRLSVVNQQYSCWSCSGQPLAMILFPLNQFHESFTHNLLENHRTERIFSLPISYSV